MAQKIVGVGKVWQGFFVLKITLLCAKFVLVFGAYFSFFVMILKLVTMAFFFMGLGF